MGNFILAVTVLFSDVFNACCGVDFFLFLSGFIVIRTGMAVLAYAIRSTRGR